MASLVRHCEEDASSSDFSVISNLPDDSVVNGGSFRPDPSHVHLDDFRTRLQDLLQENAQLKEALQQNTNLMRQNFKTLGAWQEKVAITNRRHKAMLQESGRLLLEMRRENHSLRMQVHELQSSLKLKAMAEVVSLDVQKARSHLNETSLVYVDDDDVGYTVVHSFPAELPEPSSNPEGEDLESVVENSWNRASSFLQMCKDRCVTVERVMSQLHDRDDVAQALTLLKEERIARQQDEKNLQEVREEFERLRQDHRLLLHVLKSTQCEGRQTQALRAIEQRQQQELSDSLTARLVASQEELTSCRTLLEQREQQLSLLQTDSEQIPILRAQVEIYKQDFEAERASNRARTKDLEKEVEEHRRHGGGASRSRRGGRSSQAESQPTDTVAVQLTCPKCSFVFQNHLAFDNHFDRCFHEKPSPYA